jgi:hypothetical protein
MSALRRVDTDDRWMTQTDGWMDPGESGRDVVLVDRLRLKYWGKKNLAFPDFFDSSGVADERLVPTE